MYVNGVKGEKKLLLKEFMIWLSWRFFLSILLILSVKEGFAGQIRSLTFKRIGSEIKEIIAQNLLLNNDNSFNTSKFDVK